MIISANDTELILKINSEEWEDIFDMNCGEYVDVFVDNDNIDIFFPGWKEYVDHENVIPGLNIDDAARFKKLCIEFDETVGDKEGEGNYKITDISFEPAIDEENDVLVVGVDDDKEQIMMITISFSE